MKKNGVIIIIIIAIIVCVLFWGVSSYNQLVTKKETVDSKLATVKVSLKRRADLIPNLINTVKGYTKHEEKVIKEITEARENLLKADTSKDLATANNKLDSALNNLLVVVENYPDLKASANFINLQDELAGTENRISVARNDYNEAVKDYNQKIKKIPTNLIASLTGFEKENYLEIAEQDEKVPEVNFNEE